MRSKRPSAVDALLAVLAASLMTFAGSGRGSAQPAIPSEYLNNLPRLWQAIMTGFYGPYDRQRKCWISRVREPDGVGSHCMKPHKFESAPFRAARRHFFVVGGFRTSPDGTEEICFGCQGRLGLVVLGERRGQLVLVASNSLHDPFGTYGSLPAETDFMVRRLGQNDNFGWSVRDGASRGGTAYESQTLFGQMGNSIRELGRFPAGYNNLGACDSSSEPCTNYRVDLSVSEGNSSAAFYPVVLSLSGTRKGVPIVNTYTANFNAATRQYDMPAGLPLD